MGMTMSVATSPMEYSRTAESSHNLFASSSDRTRLSVSDLIADHSFIDIQSGGGTPTSIPPRWSPVLGQSDALILIPDMHMFLQHSNLDNFKFGADAMLQFLQYLFGLKRALESDGFILSVYQLGDMYELCYPDSNGRRVRVEDIIRSHPLYGEIARLFSLLGTRYVAGNHDVWFHRRNGNPFVATHGNVLMEHGFSADRWYHFTDPTKIGWDVSVLGLLAVRQTESHLHRLRRKLGLLESNDHAAIGVTSGEVEQADFPHRDTYPRRTLQHYVRRLSKMNWFERPRICAVAHTHTPMLDPNFMNGECIFVDAGAWTEGRSDLVLITNAEIAVCRYRRTPRQFDGVALRSA
jgi:hypothetical protein